MRELRALITKGAIRRVGTGRYQVTDLAKLGAVARA